MRKLTCFLFSIITLIFIADTAPARAGDKEWKLTTSGELHVVLVYAEDNIEIERKVEIKPPPKKEPSCGGGNLVAAMDCVAERIGNAGAGGGGSEEKKFKTVKEYINLRAELSGIVTPVVEVIEEGKRYSVSLDMSGMPARTKYTGPFDIFDMKRKKEILREASYVKNFLRTWSKIIGEKELTAMMGQRAEDDSQDPDDSCGTHCLTYFLDEAFSGLSHLERLRPKEAKVEVYYSAEDCFDIYMELLDVQQQNEELAGTVPFSVQFETATRILSEVEDTFSGIVGDMKEVDSGLKIAFDAPPVKAKLKEYEEAIEGLEPLLGDSFDKTKDSLQEKFDEIKLSKKFFPGRSGDIMSSMAETKKRMGKVKDATKKINDYLKIITILHDAEDMSGSDQIRALSDYIGLVQDQLGSFLDKMPVVSVFLDLYQAEIDMIADSAEKIEKVVSSRNHTMAVMRMTGDPWNFREVYRVINVAQERMKRKREALHNRLERLDGKLKRQCHIDAPWSEEYGFYDEIKDAGESAEEACKDLKRDYKDSNRIKNALDSADKEYKKARRLAQKKYTELGIKDAEEAKRVLDARKKAESLEKYVSHYLYPDERQRRNILRSIDSIKKARGYLTEAEKSIQKAISKTPENKRRVTDVNDIRALRHDIFNVQSLHKNLLRFKEAKKGLKEARENMKALRDNNKKFKDCKRDYIKRVAREKGWTMKDVNVEHSELFEK